MPRNPNKKHCQAPGCRAWAMRGDNHCRAHRDHELGPRGAGAPAGNLNALKTGENAHPLSPDQLKTLAYQIVHEPQAGAPPQPLSALLLPVIDDLQDRAPDRLRAARALSALFRQLLPHIVDHLFAAELDALLLDFPPAKRPTIRAIIWKGALPLSPDHRMLLIQAARHYSAKNKLTEKQLMGLEDFTDLP